MTPTEALDTLRNALPADPEDHGPVAVPSDAIRALVDSEPASCPDCFGKGLTNQVDQPGIVLPATDCPTCSGTGRA